MLRFVLLCFVQTSGRGREPEGSSLDSHRLLPPPSPLHQSLTQTPWAGPSDHPCRVSSTVVFGPPYRTSTLGSTFVDLADRAGGSPTVLWVSFVGLAKGFVCLGFGGRRRGTRDPPLYRVLGRRTDCRLESGSFLFGAYRPLGGPSPSLVPSR